MTQARPHSTGEIEPAQARPSAGCLRLLPAVVLLCLCGCIGNPLTLLKPGQKPAGAAPASEGLILRGDKVETETGPEAGTPAADVAAAKEFLRNREYAKAEKLFNKVASNQKNSPPIAEEARYYEAECLRLQAHYPKAVSTFNKQLKDFPSGTYHLQACQRIFDIANYWLDETRDQMDAKAKKGKGPNWASTFVHFEKTKPLLDMQGHALEGLEQVYLNDPTGALGKKAVFYIGSVRFFLEEYREADHYFETLVKNDPNGIFAAKSLELSIICKQLSTGGVEYDGRRLARARELVHMAQTAYPELNEKRGDFLVRQLATINLQQAAKDFSIAEFYQRVGRSGSAYFIYEVVRRRYPNTKYAEEAAKRMTLLQAKAEQQQAHKGFNFNVWPFTVKTTPERPLQPGNAPAAPVQTPPIPGTPLLSQPETLSQPRTLPSLPGAGSIPGAPPQ